MCNSNLIIYNYIYLILRSSGNWCVKQWYFSVSLVPENKPLGFKMRNTGRDVLFTLYHMKSGVLKAGFFFLKTNREMNLTKRAFDAKPQKCVLINQLTVVVKRKKKCPGC